MINNNYYPYNFQSFTGYRIIPIGKIEEANTIYPDLQGNPMFFFDQSRNEIYVKQRKVQTGEVETLKYTPAKDAVEPIKATNYDEQISELRQEIRRIGEAISVKVRKVEKDVE